MLDRRTLLRGLSMFAACAAAAVVKSAAAVDPPASGGGGLPAGFDLKKQLETGLKARRPTDFKYIEGIVAKVQTGALPRTLVDQAYLYAREQNSPYPIVYFQFSLKKLAAKAGVPL